MKLILLALAAGMLGCAAQKQSVPNPGAVQGGLSRVQSSTTTAEEQRKQIEALNREARIKQARIDNKDIFIDAYKKWKAQHP